MRVRLRSAPMPSRCKHRQSKPDPRIQKGEISIMSEQTSDHSNVVVFPPVVPIVTIALGFALQWVFPLGVLVHVDQFDRVAIGLSLFLIGALISSSGSVTLVRSETNVLPSRPTVKIV